MAFTDEIVKLRRVVRPYIRFAGCNNPAISGSIGGDIPNEFGQTDDNTGPWPVLGTVTNLGTFRRSITNTLRSFEVPTISSQLLDEINQWRTWAAEPWLLTNRIVEYVMRVEQDNGLILDKSAASAQITEITLDPGKFSFSAEQPLGEFFGRKVPRRLVDTTDWPNADASAKGQAVPIIYGSNRNSATNIGSLAGVLVGPSGTPVAGFTGIPNPGGAGTGDTSYYAIAPVSGGTVIATPSIIGPITTVAGEKIDFTWSAYAGTADGLRLWRSHQDYFWLMNRYRDSGNPYTEVDLPIGTTSFTDMYPGVSTREQLDPDPHWDLNYPVQVFYYLSVVVGDEEYPPVGPVQTLLSPGNYSVQRKMVLSWDPVSGPGITGLKLRRATQTYHWEQVFNREWDLPVSASGHVDFMNDSMTGVGLPAAFAKKPGGAMECLLVDKNPAGTAGQFTYLVAGHGCKEVQEVYVTKTATTEAGLPYGSLPFPTGVTVIVVGTPGSTTYRYKITAANDRGETPGSNEVTVTTGNATLSGSDRNDLTWNPVEGATQYYVYRASAGGDFGQLGVVTTASFSDTGAATPSAATPPQANTTGYASSNGQLSSSAQPVLMTPGVDYTVTAETRNGHRYQLIRFVASQEGNPVTCNVSGIETLATATGNGDGGTLITRIFDQFLHFNLNWVFNSYQSGPWFTDTGYQGGLLDQASFTSGQVVSATRMGNGVGYIGAGMMTESVEVRQALEDWIISTGCDWYFWDGQYHVDLLNPTVTNRADLPKLTMTNAIFRETFRGYVDLGRMANRIPWRAGPQWDGFLLSGQVEDTTLQQPDRYGRVIEAPTITFQWLRDSATIANVAGWLLRLVKNPPLRATFSLPLGGGQHRLTTKVAVSHEDGISTSPSGWIGRAVRIVRSDLDFDARMLRAEVEDIDFLIENITGPSGFA